MKNRTKLTRSVVTLTAVGLLIFTLAHSGTAAATQTSVTKTYLILHFIERQGTVATTQYSFDTNIFIYSPPFRENRMELYLYDRLGNVLKAKQRLTGTPVDICNPCRINFTGRIRIELETLIGAAGEFSENTYLGRANMVITGRPDDLDQLKVEYWLINSHSSPFDLSLSILQLEPLPGAVR